MLNSECTEYTGWPSYAGQWEDLFGEVETPCYVYSERILRQNLRHVLSMVPGKTKVFFALMANDNPGILNIMQEEGTGFFGGSDFNLQRIIELGIHENGVVFAPSGFTRRSIEMVSKVPNLTVFANSVGQHRMLTGVNPNLNAGIRLNFGEARLLKSSSINQKHYAFLEDRIGLTFEALLKALIDDRKLKESLMGIHIYPGTNISSADQLLAKYEAAIRFANELEIVSVVDLGGGLPSTCNIPFASEFWDKWVSGLSALYDGLATDRKELQINLELGRMPVAESGAFVTSVLDIVESSEPPIIICDANLSLFPRPFYYKEASNQHPVTVLGKSMNDVARLWAVAGCTTFSGDIMQMKAALPQIDVGDRLLFWNAGAYCCAMSMRFLGAPRPYEILWTGKKAKDISLIEVNRWKVE